MKYLLYWKVGVYGDVEILKVMSKSTS